MRRQSTHLLSSVRSLVKDGSETECSHTKSSSFNRVGVSGSQLLSNTHTISCYCKLMPGVLLPLFPVFYIICSVWNLGLAEVNRKTWSGFRSAMCPGSDKS